MQCEPVTISNKSAWHLDATAPQRRPLLTLHQVAELLGVSKAWVRDHATRRNPRIPVVRFGDKRAVLRFRIGRRGNIYQ